jgi:hypothetical protein
MTIRPACRPTWLFDLAAFLAVLVGAIILISAVHADPLIVRAVTDAAAACLGWRIFADRRRPSRDAGATRAWGRDTRAPGSPTKRA